MILQALYNYYEAMLRAERIATPGLEVKLIRWVIVIREDGSFVRTEDLKDPDDTTSKGRDYLVIPDVNRTSGVQANCLWDNKKYVLGIRDKLTADNAKQCLFQFIQTINFFAEQYPQNKAFKAVQRFYEQGFHRIPEVLEAFNKAATNDLITFQLNSSTTPVASDDDALAWAEAQISSGDERGLCLLSGKEDFLIKKHPPIQLLNCKRGSAAPLVSFNKRSFCSYGRKESDLTNAPMSKYAAFAYATAFNDLANNENTCYDLGPIRYVFWNSNLSEDINNIFRRVAFVRNEDDDREEKLNPQEETPKHRKRKQKNLPNPTEDTYKVLEQFKAIRGNRGYGEHWSNTREFYILGVLGGARGAVKYWQQGTVSEIFTRLYQHLIDMNIVNSKGFVDEENPPLCSLYDIVYTVSTTSESEKFQINLIQSIVESILDGTPYPLTLQQACINRITQDQDHTVSNLRAAILKGCINRKARVYKHLTELHMALDKQNDNIAYLAGRIFAVLEQIQQASLGKSVNATIRDRYYASASTRPNMVMGRLIALSNHHLSKLRKAKAGLAVKLEKLLGEIYELIPGEEPRFPATFSLDEQSLFAVGYYHQKVDTYKKDDQPTETEDTEQ